MNTRILLFSIIFNILIIIFTFTWKSFTKLNTNETESNVCLHERGTNGTALQTRGVGNPDIRRFHSFNLARSWAPATCEPRSLTRRRLWLTLSTSPTSTTPAQPTCRWTMHLLMNVNQLNIKELYKIAVFPVGFSHFVLYRARFTLCFKFITFNLLHVYIYRGKLSICTGNRNSAYSFSSTVQLLL